MPTDALSLERCRSLLKEVDLNPAEDELLAIHDQAVFLADVIVQTYEDLRDGLEHFDPSAMRSAGSRGFLTLIGLDPDEIDEIADELFDEAQDEAQEDGE